MRSMNSHFANIQEKTTKLINLFGGGDSILHIPAASAGENEINLTGHLAGVLSSRSRSCPPMFSEAHADAASTHRAGPMPNRCWMSPTTCLLLPFPTAQEAFPEGTKMQTLLHVLQQELRAEAMQYATTRLQQQHNLIPRMPPGHWN